MSDQFMSDREFEGSFLRLVEDRFSFLGLAGYQSQPNDNYRPVRKRTYIGPQRLLPIVICCDVIEEIVEVFLIRLVDGEMPPYPRQPTYNNVSWHNIRRLMEVRGGTLGAINLLQEKPLKLRLSLELSLYAGFLQVQKDLLMEDMLWVTEIEYPEGGV